MERLDVYYDRSMPCFCSTVKGTIERKNLTNVRRFLTQPSDTGSRASPAQVVYLGQKNNRNKAATLSLMEEASALANWTGKSWAPGDLS